MKIAPNKLQKPVWKDKMIARGGRQGSRLMMVAFVFSMAHALDTASRQLIGEGIAMSCIGYQDDQYMFSIMTRAL